MLSKRNELCLLLKVIFTSELLTVHVHFQAVNTPRGSGSGSFEVLTLGLTLGNGSGTDFQASQCIPIQAAMILSTLPLALGVFIPIRPPCCKPPQLYDRSFFRLVSSAFDGSSKCKVLLYVHECTGRIASRSFKSICW